MLLSLSFSTDWCSCHCGRPLLPSFHPRLHYVRPLFWDLCHLCNYLIDCWPNGLLLPPLFLGQTVKTPTSWDPTGGHLSSIQKEKFPKDWHWLCIYRYFPTQLSALKFVDWMLVAFLHSLPPAYFFYCHSKEALWLDLTYWLWVLVWPLILLPQVFVLAAVIRVRRFDPNLNSVQFDLPKDPNDASASGWTMKEEGLSLRVS